MDMFVVHGGRRLRGRVRVSGAKNSALPIMAAALVAEGPTVLHGVPDLVDVTTLGELLTALGVAVTRQGTATTSAIDVRIPAPDAIDANGAARLSSEETSFEDQHVHWGWALSEEIDTARYRGPAVASGSRRRNNPALPTTSWSAGCGPEFACSAAIRN